MAGVGYQMFRNEDMEEGMGKDIPIPGIFANQVAAIEASVGRGVYGAPAVVKPVPLFENAEEFAVWEKEQDPDYQLYLALKNKFGE